MPEGTLTRLDLREATHRAVPSISRDDARNIVDATLEEISEALVRGETVSLRAFGNFKVRAKRERLSRNPRTGVEAKITSRRVVTFRASPLVLKKINGLGLSARLRKPKAQ
ncbi:integration host factor subunit alpha [Methylocystis sp. IM4]|uniref:integration host factor subunit alpha n=1 Tax=Methylocystis sp. IM4 TaxID=3136560 RepID=UPI00311A4FB4